MGKIKKVAMGIGSFFAYNEKQFYRFLWSAIALSVVIVCYYFISDNTWLHNLFLGLVIVAAIVCACLLLSFIVSLLLTQYNRKLDKAKMAEERKKNEFETVFRAKKYKDRPVYDTLKEVFSHEGNQKANRVVPILYVAKRIDMITIEPSYADVKKYFGVEVVGAGGSYSAMQAKNTKKPIAGEDFQAMSVMLTNTLEEVEARQKVKKPGFMNNLLQIISNPHK